MLYIENLKNHNQCQPKNEAVEVSGLTGEFGLFTEEANSVIGARMSSHREHN